MHELSLTVNYVTIYSTNLRAESLATVRPRWFHKNLKKFGDLSSRTLKIVFDTTREVERFCQKGKLSISLASFEEICLGHDLRL